ncbi:MAG: DUF3048 domain-containing protein, partial [Vallitaleaceae bacterium]|nr:DUF3048 domain-containing protein [Vallitaleaceae bacterium]
MMKKWVLLLLFLSFIVMATSCNKKKPEVVVSEVTTTELTTQVTEEVTEVEPGVPEVDLHLGQAINPLTGLYISEEAAKRRPIGIMINNLKDALPQSGIAQADIIFETMVEGAICRLFAVFQDFDSTKIGPIRSARHYFLDFAFDYDALYVHYGQSPQAQAAIVQLQAPAMNGLSYLDTIMCFQDPERVRPHSTYTSFDGLMAAWDEVDFRKELKPDFVHKFAFS